jgi:general secretion pathway protein E
MNDIIKLLLSQNVITQEQYQKVITQKTIGGDPLEVLITTGVLSALTLYRFIATQIKNRRLTIHQLNNYEFLSVKEIAISLANQLGIEFVDLDHVHIDEALLNKVSISQLKRFQAIPIASSQMQVTVAFSDPMNFQAKDGMQHLFLQKPIQQVVAVPSQIASIISNLEHRGKVNNIIADIRKELSTTSVQNIAQDESAILKLIETIIDEAIHVRASDIHIEPTSKNLLVRVRVDGKLINLYTLERDIYAPLSSRFKLLAQLDIAEKRKPQDGRFSMIVDKKNYDFRISTLPILYGESIVIRILDKSKVMMRLEEIGMDRGSYQKLQTVLQAPYGIILVTGPTGSGKTTTLYGALNELKDTSEKIITVEDPIEYQMDLVQQVHVNTKVGLTFASALRSILRQDPDKVMVGEIRDQETLRIAIQAALTGHLVLSTLHTNDATSAITRMSDMGIESYLISGALVGVIAQRLVRKICTHCKRKTSLNPQLRKRLGNIVTDEIQFYKGQGCKMCSNTGYLGREMIVEVLTISETLTSMIARGASQSELLEQAKNEGFERMFDNGIKKVIQGVTTVEEILRVSSL